MSTSLEKDLHSVYIDGELPEDFVSKYESELEKDEKAKSELEKMNKIHNLLKEDADSKTVDKNFADASFERLMTKMSYAKNVRKAEKPSFVVPFTKYAASFAAAAAVFVAVFIPVYRNGISSANAKSSEVAAIEIKNNSEIKPISEKQIVVDDNLKQTDLSSRIAVASAVAAATNSEKDILNSSSEDLNSESDVKNATSGESATNTVEQKTIRASALVSGGNSRSQFNFPQVDPFRPDFSESQFKFSVPRFEEIQGNLNSMHN